MGLDQIATRRAILIAAATGLMAIIQLSNTAKAAEITIRGSEAEKLYKSLASLGVREIADDQGGSTISTKELDCYKPVVPNPKAHCYVLEHSQLTEFFDDSALSEAIYQILDVSGAGYDDGSVGATKVGLREMSCYQGLRSAVTECQGQTWN